MPREELSILIWAALKRAGYKTVYGAAKAIGMDEKHLRQIVKGQVSPTVDTLERVFNAIGYEVIVQFRPAK